SRFSIALLVAAPLATFGVAGALLAAGIHALAPSFVAQSEGLRNVPAYGFVFAAVFFAAHLHEKSATTPERRARGHALNAIVLSTLVCTLFYDASFVEFIPFYYNEPLIPIALLCLFIAMERTGVAAVTPLVLALLVLPVFGTKLNRALSDDTL